MSYIINCKPEDEISAETLVERVRFHRNGLEQVLTVSKIQEVTYKHPEAPEHAFFKQIEEREFCDIYESSKDFPKYYLLYIAQKAIDNSRREVI